MMKHHRLLTTSLLILATVGSTLGAAPGLFLTEEPAPEIPTDQLSMSEPRQGSLEAYQKPVEPAPLPDIAHLELEEAERKEKPQGKARFVIADD
jgi:hypothetical protein